MSCYAIIAAGGSGSRMGGSTVKTLQTLAGRPVICRSAAPFAPLCDGLVIAAREGDIPLIREAMEREGIPVYAYVSGGIDRSGSVQNALRALPDDCDLVLVQDGARPLVKEELIRAVIESTELHGSGVPALALTDTVKRVDARGRACETLDRGLLRGVQTPQGFRRELLERAYRERRGPATDDASLVEALGMPVCLVEGDRDNIKLTLPGDLERAEAILLAEQFPRVGLGYDVHRLAEGRRLILCGVDIPFELGLLGHSDADVAAHALTDALLGACAMGDIGAHFPDTDERFRGADSIGLLKEAVRRMAKHGFVPYNCDITIAAQRPRLLPYIPLMRDNLAQALGIPIDRVSVKATTTEGLGFEGRGEGMSAQAVAMVVKLS